MSALAYLTEWARLIGPVGIGAIGLSSALVAWVGISGGQMMRANARRRHVETDAIEKWKESADAVNPLDQEFHRKRISLDALANPISKRISGKRFIDCELMGPANLMFMTRKNQVNRFSRVNFANCDVLVVIDDVELINVIVLEDVEVIGGAIFNSSIYIPKAYVPSFVDMGTVFATLTGYPEIDNQSHQGIEIGKPP